MGLEDLVGDTLGSVGDFGGNLIGGAGGLLGGVFGGGGSDSPFSGITGKILIGVIVVAVAGIAVALITGKKKGK